MKSAFLSLRVLQNNKALKPWLGSLCKPYCLRVLQNNKALKPQRGIKARAAARLFCF